MQTCLEEQDNLKKRGRTRVNLKGKKTPLKERVKSRVHEGLETKK